MAVSSTQSSFALFNGEIMPLSEVRISPLDRGYHFGDGIYEVFRLYSGKLFMEAAHWRRFERSLSEMQIELPDLDGVKAKCRHLAKLHPLKDAMLYLQVTRGVAAKREHGFPKLCTAQVLAMVNELPSVLPKVKTEGCSVITQPDQRWKRCDIKSLNLLGNIMGATKARELGCYECVFINDLNQATECSRSNIFAVVNGELRTMQPKLDGTFTLTTDAEILANNTEDGPKADPAGRRLVWKMNAQNPAAPMALLQLAQ